MRNGSHIGCIILLVTERISIFKKLFDKVARDKKKQIQSAGNTKAYMHAYIPV